MTDPTPTRQETVTRAEIDAIEAIDAEHIRLGIIPAEGIVRWIDRLVAHVRALLDALEAAEAERDGFKAALAEIRDNYGQVCGWFEICVHESCRASRASWIVADKALRAPDVEGASDE